MENAKRNITTRLISTDKGIDFFNSMEHLEPICPKCKVKIDWGTNTEWSDKHEAQICKACKTVLE